MDNYILTNLFADSKYYKDTIRLIETGFNYPDDHHFDIDFYPLISKDNLVNCHILIDNNKVIAHIGTLPKLLNDQQVILMGGIVVYSNYQKK